MTSLESVGKVLTTDILVVGGGIAGLAIAIGAKEAAPDADVLVLDKVVAGWGGKANKGGGNISYVEAEDGFDTFVEFHVREMGAGLEDQVLLRAYAEQSRANLERLEGWGVHIFRDEAGAPKFIRWTEGLPWRMAVMDQDVTLNLAKRARKLGVRFVDRVATVDLLKDGDRVVGAIGFGMLDGACVVVSAGATVLANGNQNYKLMRRWASGRGDGIAAAYRAGAVMRNAEFGNFINWVFTDTKEVCQGAEDVLYNSKGEHITKAIRPVIEPDCHSKEVVAWWKEMKAGNGPVCANMPENFIMNVTSAAFHSDALAVRPISTAFWSMTIGKAMAASTVKGPMQPVLPGFIGEQSCVKVDHEMATTVPGLFAIGDTSLSGSSWPGAVPAPPGRMRGIGLGNAVFSAGLCTPAAVAAASAGGGVVDADQAAALKERMYAPLKKGAGNTAPGVVRAVQDVMSPVGNSIYKRQDRMEEALDTVLAIKDGLPELSAEDPHYLSACHEAAAMVLSAELFYRTSMARPESRGWHLREDYPERNDANCLKWIDVVDDGGEMAISTTDVPVKDYPVEP